ncbi:MAG: hypothetical protein LBD46_06840 [Endomicrobium sp.]|jgi:hypothetical protein|nr:hypothetical protein [Endomicrobium sp.]
MSIPNFYLCQHKNKKILKRKRLFPVVGNPAEHASSGYVLGISIRSQQVIYQYCEKEKDESIKKALKIKKIKRMNLPMLLVKYRPSGTYIASIERKGS